MTKKIKLAIVDPIFQKIPPLGRLLQKNFPIEFVAANDADFLLYGDFGIDHMNFKGVKIFFTEENYKARWCSMDYALTHEINDCDRQVRVPYYMYYLIEDDNVFEQNLIERTPITLTDLEAHPRKFCNFITRNHVCKIRNLFFKKLNSYKRVDSAGPYLNNMPEGYILPKGQNVNFIKDYKFNMSFENEKNSGYTTEKILFPLLARSIPIYWGNRDVNLDFNPASFINYDDYKSEEELIEYLLKIDQDDELLLSYLNAPALNHPDDISRVRNNIIKKFEIIFQQESSIRTNYEKFCFEIDKRIGWHGRKRLRAWSRKLRGKA